MSKGIYGYYDSENNYILVYPGKDSHIDENRRHRDHLNPSRYDEQQINRVLQNNPDRYEYRVICEYPDLTDDELNWLECMEIMKHKFLYGERPKFSFTVGGDGRTGYRKPYEDFEYSVAKCGFKENCKQNYTIHDRNHNPIKQSINKEALEEIAVALNNGEITEEEVKAFKYTVTKMGFHNGKQRYSICNRNNKEIKTSINKEILDEIAVALNNGSLSEEEAKAIKIELPFEYTVSKKGFRNGKQQYGIRNRGQKYIKSSINKEALDKIAIALNNGSLTEEEVKNNRGVDFIWV
jgi:hypothetical protein